MMEKFGVEYGWEWRLRLKVFGQVNKNVYKKIDT